MQEHQDKSYITGSFIIIEDRIKKLLELSPALTEQIICHLKNKSQYATATAK